MAIVLSLASSLCWGTADFVGGLQSRSLPALAVALWSQVAGLLVLFLTALLLHQVPTVVGAPWGFVGGLAGGTGLLLFYSALARGVMSLVAPVAACGAVIPVVVSLLLGHRPGALAAVALIATLAGVVLLSLQGQQEHHARMSRSVLLLALGAATSFGVFYVGLDRAVAAAGAVVWPTVAARVGSLALLLATSIGGRQALPWPGRRSPVVAGVGALDTTANVLFAAATTQGDLGVVSVLGSLYPLVTVLLGRVLLAERLAAVQGAGVVLALVGVILLSTAPAS